MVQSNRFKGGSSDRECYTKGGVSNLPSNTDVDNREGDPIIPKTISSTTVTEVGVDNLSANRSVWARFCSCLWNDIRGAFDKKDDRLIFRGANGTVGKSFDDMKSYSNDDHERYT